MYVTYYNWIKWMCQLRWSQWKGKQRKIKFESNLKKFNILCCQIVNDHTHTVYKIKLGLIMKC